jgi:phosphoribosyl 1,2-cyclic phosphodiesterase
VRARIWGCRGSLAAPGPDTVRYGGNTSCVEVALDDGTVLILDAGTGIRPLGRYLHDQGATSVHLLLTHLHLDHLQGLGFFRPFFEEGMDVHIWGPRSPTVALRDRIALYLSPPLFPVRLADVGSTVTFHDAPDDPWTIGPASVTAMSVTHQGPTLGYRIEEGSQSLAYIPDHEPSLGVDLNSLQPEWISGHDLADHVDVLLHDSQYTEDEYDDHVGWGHSSAAHAVAFGRIAGVGRLVLFHHDPFHDDDDLERLLGRARRLWGDAADTLELAYEGMVIDLAAAAPATRAETSA